MATELSIPRSVHTQNTKDKIYKAAASILKKKGYAYLSVSNICKTAGVSNGTFFYHFKSKEDLLSYYANEKFFEYQKANSFDAEGLPFDQKVLAFYQCWLSYMESSGIEFVSSYYTSTNTALNVRNSSAYRTVYSSFVLDAFTEAAEQDLLISGVSLADAEAVCATITKGVIMDWCVSDGVSDMHLMLKRIMVPYLNSIKK